MCSVLSNSDGLTVSVIVIVFDMIRPGRTPMIYHSHAEHGNRYVTDAVFAFYEKYVSFTKERPCHHRLINVTCTRHYIAEKNAHLI
jgi:hypothetical protein